MRVTFDEALPVAGGRAEDLVALDDALKALAQFDERKSKVIELRFFGGLSVEENGGRSERLRRHGHAGLEAGKGVAISRDACRHLRN